MECKIKYTPEILHSLNRKNIHPIDPQLFKFFHKFPKNKYPNVPYQNLLNRNFPAQHRKKIIPDPTPFSDDKIIADLKELLLKLNEENKTTIINDILQLNFTENIEQRVAELIHDITVNCIFLVQVYVDVILSLEGKCKTLIEKINKCIIQQLYKPREFSTENDGFACETAEQKTKKWRINNAILISELFLRDKYHHQFMVNHVLVPLINKISLEDTVNIEILNKILPTVGAKLELKHGLSLSTTFNQLEKIAKDKAYPSRLRFLIMDIMDFRNNKYSKK